ncbi:hypothetical protein EVA_18882 [gut metagenome]|uniref:Uncharacterized protein n=1 Tax=gut metagenome TaxID=749906 RepID=J9FTX5_9ZZZZ
MLLLSPRLKNGFYKTVQLFAVPFFCEFCLEYALIRATGRICGLTLSAQQ